MTSNRQLSNSQPPVNIKQEAKGCRVFQFGQVFGNVIFQVLPPKTAIIILVFLSLVAVSLFCLYRTSQEPARMTGDFNIAIAQFGEVTNQGIALSARATQISQVLFDFLDSEYKATDLGLEIQVAHKNIGIITEDREAEQLVNDIGADVLIYGTVFIDGDSATLSPRFFIANRPDIQELTGQHRLALPITFTVSELAFQDKINAELRSRASILVLMTEGLTFLSAKDFAKGLRCFQQAIHEAEKHGRFDGQEVLYLLAATASHLNQNPKEADEYIDKSLSLNPEYARAYIARGNIYYTQALEMSFDEILLNEALSEYQRAKRAIEAQDQPPGAYIREKVNISLGNIYVVQAQKTRDIELFSEAIDAYSQVVAEYEKVRCKEIWCKLGIYREQSPLKEFASIAYFGLGAAYERQESYYQAENAYKQCIDLTGDSQLRSRADRQLELVQSKN